MEYVLWVQGGTIFFIFVIMCCEQYPATLDQARKAEQFSNGASHSGGPYWVYYPGALSFKSFHPQVPGGWFNIKMTSYQYRKSHCGDKTILRPSYLQNGISYTGKMTSLYWIRSLIFKWVAVTWQGRVGTRIVAPAMATKWMTCIISHE